ncbi:hypothetical protein BDZ89DRAFT_1006028 [Hymenopellis radicata]|nr:hypothetical protein BDZ89DRAFT_1006028 [Hymenopellis radicata]
MSDEATSPPLNAENNYYLSFVGLSIVGDSVGLLCESVFWAVYLVMFCYAMWIQTRRGLRSPPTIAIFCVTCVLFASSTTLWVLNFTVYFTRVKEILNEHADLGLLERIYASNAGTERYGLPMETLFLFNMIIGDGVVIWRAWVLWQGSRMQKLVVLPMIMLLTSFVFSAIALSCLAANSFGGTSTIPGGSRTCQWGEPIAWAISLLTNVTSTSLIAIRAWQHRQFLKSSLGRLHRKSISEKVLVLLVESGFIYCFFWLSQLILFFDIQPGARVIYLYYVLSTMGDQISGIYPTAIIILVNTQRSMSSDNQYFSGHADLERTPQSQELTSLQFRAPGHTETKTLPDFQPFVATNVSMTESGTTSRVGGEV